MGDLGFRVWCLGLRVVGCGLWVGDWGLGALRPWTFADGESGKGKRWEGGKEASCVAWVLLLLLLLLMMMMMMMILFGV